MSVSARHHPTQANTGLEWATLADFSTLVADGELLVDVFGGFEFVDEGDGELLVEMVLFPFSSAMSEVCRGGICRCAGRAE